MGSGKTRNDGNGNGNGNGKGNGKASVCTCSDFTPIAILRAMEDSAETSESFGTICTMDTSWSEEDSDTCTSESTKDGETEIADPSTRYRNSVPALLSSSAITFRRGIHEPSPDDHSAAVLSR